MSFDGTKIVMGAISIIIGLVMLPVVGAFKYEALYTEPNATGVRTLDTNVTGVSGLSSLIDLVMYGFTFGLVGLGIGLIYLGFKGGK